MPILLAIIVTNSTKKVAKEKVPNNFLNSISLAEKPTVKRLNQEDHLDF